MDWPASPLQYENADLFSHQIQQHLAFVNSTHVNSSSHCKTRTVVIHDEKSMDAQISTDIVVFRAPRNIQRFQ